MKAIFMCYIEREGFELIPWSKFESIFRNDPPYYLGTFNWQGVFQTDRMHGQLPNDSGFLDDYDIAFVVHTYGRCPELRKKHPHLKIILMTDISSSFYSLGHLTKEEIERIRTEALSADVWLQLVWSKVEELKEYLKLNNIYSIYPIDFDSYKYAWERENENTTRQIDLIGCPRHRVETVSQSYERLKDTVKYIRKNSEKQYRFRLFSCTFKDVLENPEKYNSLEYPIKDYYLNFDDVKPYIRMGRLLKWLSECRLFLDNCLMAGPQMAFSSAFVKTPIMVNTDLGWTLMPELATTRGYGIDNFKDYLDRLKLLEDESYYNQMSELVYRRMWEKCNFKSCKIQLLKILDM